MRKAGDYERKNRGALQQDVANVLPPKASSGIRLISYLKALFGKGRTQCCASSLLSHTKIGQRDVGDLGRKDKPSCAGAFSVLGRRLEKCGARSTPPRLGNHEKIIQDKDHCHRARREAGIQLGESDCDTTIQCKKNRRIIVLKPLPKKAPPPFRVAWVTVELAIGIEKRDEDINVRDGRLPNLDFASLHAPLSR